MARTGESYMVAARRVRALAKGGTDSDGSTQPAMEKKSTMSKSLNGSYVQSMAALRESPAMKAMAELSRSLAESPAIKATAELSRSLAESPAIKAMAELSRSLAEFPAMKATAELNRSLAEFPAMKVNGN